MSNRIKDEYWGAINQLPAKLKELALEVEYVALFNDLDFHEAMDRLKEISPDAYTFEERKAALEAMGSYWD